MTDFFDDLERQLVDAAPQRRARLRRARAWRAAAVASVLVAVLAGGAGIAAAIGGGGQDDHGAPAGRGPATTAAAPAPAPHAATPRPGAYEVAVLNATTVPGLARGVANRLQNDRYKIGNVTNAAAQHRAATIVEYAPGHRVEAEQVALAIDVSPAALQPLSTASRTIAGDGAAVVVTVGSDQNTAPRRP